MESKSINTFPFPKSAWRRSWSRPATGVESSLTRAIICGRTFHPPMKYWAFLSYSHTDKKWGDWLHKALETYRVPRRLVGKESRDGKVPERVYPIFRDREELPVSADLGSNINEALGESRYLIVICSPRSAQSRWLGEEIKTFKKLGREDRILALIDDVQQHA